MSPVLQKRLLPNTRNESHLMVGLDFGKSIYGREEMVGSPRLAPI